MFPITHDLEAAIEPLVQQGLPFVVIDEHPDYEGTLVFQTMQDESVFYERYKDWVSRYLVLSQLFNLGNFVDLLTADGYEVLFTSSAKAVLYDFERWSAPLDIEGYDLHPFQTFCLNMALERSRQGQNATDRLTLFNWAPGAGKSFCAAAGAKALFATDDIDIVIAVAPNSFKLDLFRFFERSGLDVVVNDGTKAKRTQVYREEHQAYVMNYEKLRLDFDDLSDLTRFRKPLFVVDEAHNLLAEEGHNKARKALDELVKDCGATVWPMTATPVNGSALKYRDAFSMDARPRSNPLGTKKDFIARYARSVKKVTLKGRHGGRWDLVTYDWDHAALHEVRHRVGDRTVAVRKVDPGVREQFRGLQCLEEWVEMTDELNAILETIREDGRRAKKAGESRAPHVLAARIASVFPPALRHSQNEVAWLACDKNPSAITAAGSNKLAVLNDMLGNIQDAGDQVLVFCHWTEMGVIPLAKHLKVPHVLHYAVGLTQEQRQAVKDRFKATPDITCFLSSDAGSHGISMQNARYVISLDPPYSYDLLTQRNSRIDRADSHLDGLTGYVLLTRDNPTEERIWEVCDQRRRLSESVQGTHESLSYGDIDNEPGSTSLDWILGLEE